MPHKLAEYTEDELFEELVRRKNLRTNRMPDHWCDDCHNFKKWTGKGDVPDSYNPCSKKHEMKFRMPDDYEAPYGFYRRVCGDRVGGA